MKISRKRKIWFWICGALLLLGLVCALAVGLLSRRLLTQQEAERWQGESEQSFIQHSCFLADGAKVGLNEVYAFRYAMLDAFREAGIEWSDGVYPFVDAWSREDKVTISGDKRSTEAPVLAVGGEFFAFHPLRLISGSYISESDLSPDRVVLDRELAWELFGGVELVGMSVQINGVDFVVGGVVDRESDSASRRAYTGEKGFFMSYDAYRVITGQDSVGCYEVVIPEAVKGYGAQLIAEKFPLDDGEAVVNTGRFDFWRLMRIAKDLPSRAAHAGSVRYPYWENAARITENECAALSALEAALILPAAITLLVELVRLLARGKTALEDDLLPKAKEGVEEAVRVQARKRWEKKHPEDRN